MTLGIFCQCRGIFRDQVVLCSHHWLEVCWGALLIPKCWTHLWKQLAAGHKVEYAFSLFLIACCHFTVYGCIWIKVREYCGKLYWHCTSSSIHLSWVLLLVFDHLLPRYIELEKGKQVIRGGSGCWGKRNVSCSGVGNNALLALSFSKHHAGIR